MNKKLMAVAVAGALAAPAVAMAQSTSTVQIYGSMYMEYSFVNTSRALAGNDTANADILQTPGSEVGIKGEEKLGGNMSAWFQCNSSADPRGVNGDGFCTRNSAVGLKGNFGNFFVGNWDTPFKRTIGAVGGRDTGIFGTAFLLTGNSTTTTDGASAGVFKRRQRNLLTYDSPSFGGFQVMGAFSSTNSSTATTATSAGAKPRIMSIAASYKAGKLDLGAGYEKHTDAYANVAQPGNATVAGDEHGYHLSAAYTFGPVKLGGTYTQQKAEPILAGVARDAKLNAWHLGAEWKIAGPHNLHAGYTQANDMKGAAGAAMGSRPVVTAASDTGAKLYQIRYLYDFSKRTTGTIGYVNLKNDNSASYALGGLSGAAVGAGTKQSAIAMSISHKF